MMRLGSVALAIACAASVAPAQAGDAADAAKKVMHLLQQAEAAEQIGNPDEAESLLRAALDVDAGNAAAVTALGRFLCAHENGAEGIALLYRAVELAPADADANVALLDALLADHAWYESQGDETNAVASLGRARDLVERAHAAIPAFPAQLELRRVRVLTRSADGAKEAFTIACGLVAADPANEEFHGALVDAATAAQEFDATLAFYEQSAVEPWLKSWFSAATRAARATYNFNHYEDDEQAVADYLAADTQVLEAARLHPDAFDAASERASFYRSWAGWVRFTRQQRTEEAWDLFMSAFGRNPANASAIEGMSWACQRIYEAGDLEKFREYSRQLCIIVPDRADFWNNYGLVCRDTGQYEESFRSYRRAMALAPDDGRIVNDCALILQYHLHRDLDLCERWLIRAEDLSRAALVRAKEEEDEGATNEHRAVLGDALTNLARLYSDQGRMQEAAEHWNELREIDATRRELPENGGEANLPVAPAPPVNDAPPAGGNG